MFERESPDAHLKELAAQLRAGSALVLASRFAHFWQIGRDEQLHAGLLGTIWIGIHGMPSASDDGEDAEVWSHGDTRMHIGVVNPVTGGEDFLRDTLVAMQNKDWSRDQVVAWLESAPKAWTDRPPNKKRSFR